MFIQNVSESLVQIVGSCWRTGLELGLQVVVEVDGVHISKPSGCDVDTAWRGPGEMEDAQEADVVGGQSVVDDERLKN